ncbi:hypothetical protein SAMN02745121_00242 [Nannocystis exedens]|uniref:Protein kinase domain-containing protein n=1 Tax=Nannocystis exedens TaxID=54 RepID=A0A1I1SSP5_9BACT|nr:hypothetical protein [Nannocystis exedens]PCC75701.1 hypothetical protein NAEX_08814 [Nannocystis exedens]SFD49475.1 hypothetical protein SAMN02745121_00242 [Nannocystis exedens]
MSLDRTLAATGAVIGADAGAWATGGLANGTAVDRYIVLGRLGAGAMGVVYSAHDQELDRRVALRPGSTRSTTNAAA